VRKQSLNGIDPINPDQIIKETSICTAYVLDTARPQRTHLGKTQCCTQEQTAEREATAAKGGRCLANMQHNQQESKPHPHRTLITCAKHGEYLV